MTDIITIMCLVHLDRPDHAFPVRIGKTSLVGDLKELIKLKKENYFRYVDADNLALWQVNIPGVDKLALNKVNFEDEHVVKLRPFDEIIQYFAEQPIKGHIHVIIEPPLGISFLPSCFCNEFAF
jgi:Crinkler effector protein N-terminal domain